MENEFSHLINALPGLVWSARPDGSAEFFNQHYLTYIGLTLEQAQDSGWTAAVHPDDLNGLIASWLSIMASGLPGESEARLRHFDGEFRWFLFRANPMRNETGAIVKWLGINTDIDDLKHAQESRERDLRSIIDAIPTAAWSTRPDGYCDFLNQRWLDFTGIRPDDAFGWGWAAMIHTDDRGVLEDWRSCLASGRQMDTEIRVRRFDGAYRWFLFRASPLRDESGKIVKWYGTNIDIEDRKRGEEAMRASEVSWRQIVDNIPGLIATTGAMGEVEFLNRQTLEYFGKTNEELKEWSLIGAVHPDDLPGVIEARVKSIEAGQVYDVDHRCRRADGVYRWFHVRGVPVRDEEGTIAAWYLLLTDIDDRKKTEEALEASQRNLSLIINAIRIYIVVLDPEGAVLYVNQTVLDYHGATLEDVQEKGYRPRFFHPDDLRRVSGERQKALARGVPFENEQRLLRYDGTYRWFLVRYDPLLNQHGQIDRWYVAATDIEDRKRAEEALRASELSWRKIIDDIPGYLHTTNAMGEVEFVNRQSLEYYGKTIEELKDWSRVGIIHPDDLPGVTDAWRESVELGRDHEMEQRGRRADGVYRWFHCRARPVRNADGEITAWYWLLIDIEDRKRAEAQVEQAYLRLAEAQRLSKTGSFIVDLLADEHNWSDETFRIFEFDPATKVTMQMVRNVVHPEDLPSFEAVIARGMTGADVDFAFRIVPSLGTVKHVRGMARLITQDAEHLLFIGAVQDVTDNKVIEDALNRARSELTHVSRVATLNTLTSSITHEVNQPLAGIITNASTCLRMLDGDPPNIDGARETARRTLRDGSRASDVISRLRTLYRNKEFALEPVDLNEAAREVVALSLSDLQRNRVILRSELADDLPLVIGDRVQLQQVILNLLRNAADAMRSVQDRPRELLIRTHGVGEDRVALKVKDTGVGFTPAVGDKLFQAFYTTKRDGMGIGLSVSRSIIERHRGRLWAEPNDGPGATFSFSIPRDPSTIGCAAPQGGFP